MGDGTFEARLSRDYGMLSLSLLGVEDTVHEYDVVLEIPDGDSWKSAETWRTDQTYLAVSGYVNYYCQESGYEGKLRFRADALKDGKSVASAVSDEMDTSETYPKEEVLSFDGKNIPEDLWNFSYAGTGDSVDMIFSYSVSREDGEIIYRADYYDQSGHHEKEKKLTDQDYEEFLGLLEKGKVKRKYYSDPEIHRLDGSDISFTILWESESLLQQNNYRYTADEQTINEIIDWLISKR